MTKITFTRYMVRFNDGTYATKSRWSSTTEASKAQIYQKKGDAQNRAARVRWPAVVVPVTCTVQAPGGK
jgi:hypothetical protein